MLSDRPEDTEPDEPTEMFDAAAHAALAAALLEIDRHVHDAGWEQQPTLYALARTRELAAAEPGLVTTLGLDPDADPEALTPVEQDTFPPAADLTEALAQVSWPPAVAGCALMTVRTFLPPDAEDEIPADPIAAAEFVAEHPRRVEVRIVVGAHRDGHRHGVGRLANHPDDVFGATDLVPGLADALAATLAPDEATDPGTVS
ncbi:PPA1309 family protein [Microlunatus sp. Y2014]|uniref:PPA1309 family protein n=1 Tax=Microlunatus sp. Y2014 TaxID=3418488 RepID=UPI003DA6D3A2